MGYQQKSYKKFVATAATATLVASAIVPVASAAGFKDVPADNEFAPFINALVDQGIINGYASDNTFRPSNKLTRGQVAIMLGRWLENNGEIVPTDWNTVQRFNDVPVNATTASGKELAKYAALVKETGVFTGVLGSLNPGQNITRENMAVVLDRVASAVTGFSLVEVAEEIDDVTVADLDKAQAAYQDEIQALADLGITTVSNFRPKEQVSRAQFAKFLYTTFEVIEEVLAPATADELKAEVASIVGTLPAVNTITADNAAAAKATAAEATTALAEVEKTVTDGEYTEAEVTELNKVIADAKTAIAAVNTKADEVIEATKDLVVESVQAINGSTIQVKFNKAVKRSTVIDATDTLVDGVFTYEVDVTSGDSTTLDTKKAELSEDGKTLTIYNAAILEGNYVFKIVKDVILTADGSKALPAVEVKFNIKDTTRAAIESVKNESKYVFNINLTEPVQASSLTGITATLADGTAVNNGSATLTNNGKTIQVALVNNNNSVNAGKDVTVTIPALTDYAGNVSVPLTQTVKVSNSDVTAPKLVSAISTSSKTIEVTFDEAVTIDTAKTTTNFNKFKFNGSAADTVISSIAPKTGDTTKTKFVVTLVDDQTTAAYLDLLAGAATDLSGNDLEATSKLVTFITDKTAPTIVSNSVQKIGGVNYLVVNFSEKVDLVGSSALTFKYKDEFGVEQTTVLSSADVATAITANGTDDKSYKIALTNVSPALKTGVEYTVEFAKGYFKDAFLNDLEKTSVKFVNNSSDATTTKLVATVGTEGVDADGRFINVSFDKTVDPASATNKSNYTVEGATVKEVKLATNTAASGSVKVYLAADTVELSGNYQVTVNNVKGFNSSITAIDPTTKTVAITENVAAKVKTQSITFGTNTVIDLTFDENVTVGTGTDFDLYIDGVKSTATVATAQNGANGVKVTVTGLNLSTDIASAKKVVLKANSTFDLVDDNSNVASTLDIVLN